MFSLDTNILIYAHNIQATLHQPAKLFVESVMNDKTKNGQGSVCIPSQVLLEFIHVITWSRLEHPLSLPKAQQIVESYLKTGVKIIYPKPTHLQTFLELLSETTSRKKIFDVSLAAALKDNAIEGIYTVNTADFQNFEFLKVVNPLSNT